MLWVSFISLIIAGNSKLLKKILLYGLPVFISTPFILSESIKIANFEISIFWIVWLVYMTWVYRTVAFYNDDIDLNVPGKADDENKALSNMWIFSKEFSLTSNSPDKNKLFPQFRLLTAYTSNIYIQLFLLLGSLFLFFSLKSTLLMRYGLDPDYSTITVLSFSFFLMMTFSNPKYILLQGEEFLYTRALSRGKIYLSNYLYQGIFVLLVALITFIMPNNPIIFNFNLLNIFLTCLWIFLGGELSIILLLFLSISDISFTSLRASDNTYLTTSLFVNILSPTINSVILWLSVIVFRVFDYLWFTHKEIGFIKEWKQLAKGLSLLYIPTFILCLSATMFTTYNHPFTTFLNQMYHNSKPALYDWTRYQDWSNINTEVLSALFTTYNNENQYIKTKTITKTILGYFEDSNRQDEYKSRYSQTNTIMNILKEPDNDKLYLELSKEFIDEISDHYIYLGSLYSYSSDEVSLLIDKSEYLLNKVQLLKDTTEYNYQKSILEKVKGNTSEAIIYAQKSVKNNDDNLYLYNLAELYNQELKNNESIKIYEKIYASHDPKFKVLKRIGEIYWNDNQYTKAIDYYARSTAFEGSVFQRKNYSYLGLCDQLKAIESKDYYAINPYLAGDLQRFATLCPQIIKNVEILKKSVNFLNRRVMDNEEFRNFEALDIDYAKMYEDQGDLVKAEKELKSNYSPSKDRGYLALIQIKLGKKDQARFTINEYLRELKSLYHPFSNHYFRNHSKYKPNIYKAILLLDYNYVIDVPENTNISDIPSNYKYSWTKLDTAKNMILSSGDTEKAWLDLQSLVDKKDLSKLKNFKNQYEDLYLDSEKKGFSLISGKKSVEKTVFLIQYLNESEKIEYKDIIAAINNISKK